MCPVAGYALGWFEGEIYFSVSRRIAKGGIVSDFHSGGIDQYRNVSKVGFKTPDYYEITAMGWPGLSTSGLNPQRNMKEIEQLIGTFI